MSAAKPPTISALAELASDVEGSADDAWSALEAAALAGVTLPPALLLKAHEVLAHARAELQALAGKLSGLVEPERVEAPPRTPADSRTRPRVG